MTLTFALALLLLIGALALAVVSALAYRLYRRCIEQTAEASVRAAEASLRDAERALRAASHLPEPPRAPYLDVPAPHPPPTAPAPSSDGVPFSLDAPAPSTSAPAPSARAAHPLQFHEYDGEAFVPVDPAPVARRNGAPANPSDDPDHANGLAWR